MKSINKAIMKKDTLQLVTGKPAYTADLMPSDCLIVKALRSPHANAIVRAVHTERAKKSPV